MSVFLLVVTLVAISYTPSSSQLSASVESAAPDSQPQPNSVNNSTTVSVDKLVAVNIASSLAESTDLPVSSNVANLSQSLAVESSLSQTDSGAISKPQIFQPTAGNQSVQKYTVVDGDTVQSVAAKFSISTDTLKWANNLTSDNLNVGAVLEIPPTDGVIYTAKDGDTVQTIADKFGANTEAIIAYNDLELQGNPTSGTQVFIPKGVMPVTERPGYVAPQTILSNTYGRYGYAGGFAGGEFLVVNPSQYINVGLYATTRAGYNGQCTWYAFFRRAAMGMDIPDTALGNAADWTYTLGRLGHRVDSSPSVGAIIQNGGGYGHVGVVEAVNADGSIVITEMNNYAAGGLFTVDRRNIPAYAVSMFNYIH